MRPAWLSSYGWSNYDEDGWGARYYFTYYTTLGERSAVSVSLEAAFFALVLCLSVVANVAIIVAVLRRKEIQTVTNCFIVNLAFADLVFVLGIPAIIAARVSPQWNLGEFTCKLLPYSQFVCGSVLLWTLTGISVDRVLCLAAPSYCSGLNRCTVIISCILTWFFSFILHVPSAVFFREQVIQQNSTTETFNRTLTTSTNLTICTLVFPSSPTNYALIFTIPTIVISCVIPMAILVINYHKIFSKLEDIQKRLEENAGCVDLSGSRLRQSVQSIANNLLPGLVAQRSVSEVNKLPLARLPSSGGLQRLAKHKKAVRFLYFNVITVLFMWLPMPIVMFLIYFDGHRSDTDFFLSTTQFLLCVSLAFLNTVINPILYGFLTENFQKNFPLSDWLDKKIWHRVTVDADNSRQGNSNSEIVKSFSRTPQLQSNLQSVVN